ncbi:FUSC family protein, partial [Streptomyces beijiangensis]|nr:FUSC family protein [Streptomyces beijiangensis]
PRWTAGPLLAAAVLAGRPSIGVMSALGAMLAGINDRPGSRRAAVRRLAVPAIAGACGLMIGAYAMLWTEGGRLLPLLLTLLGLIAGATSAVGPVASAAGTQLLVASAIGAGMALPEPGWQRGLFFLAGAGWLLTLRLVLPTPHGRYDGERLAVAAVYTAVADLLTAVGGPHAQARRAALTTALDQAQDALSGHRFDRAGASEAGRRLYAQYTAALPLAEAATALAWSAPGPVLPVRAAEGPRRLAAAVRTGAPCGPLPAPSRDDAGLRALDNALLHAAQAFDSGTSTPLDARRPTPTAALRKAIGPAGREYGTRVALCFGASAAIAQVLHHSHWYWLPATAVFLVKPDLGPLASRVLCRALGTVAGAVVFAGLAAGLPRPAGMIAVVAVCGALIPFSTRHFAAQTAVVTTLVLALVMAGGEPQASWSRIAETLLACGIVLLVGHLPWPGQSGGGVRSRVTTARDAAHAYVQHVLNKGQSEEDRAARWLLRREAYRTLAAARTAIDLAAAELPALARHTADTDAAALTLEQLVGTTTACAVQLDDSGHLPHHHADRLGALLAASKSASAC